MNSVTNVHAVDVLKGTLNIGRRGGLHVEAARDGRVPKSRCNTPSFVDFLTALEQFFKAHEFVSGLEKKQIIEKIDHRYQKRTLTRMRQIPISSIVES
jgi:hypothetical protein